MEYVVWSNPLALLSHKLFKTTWGRHEITVNENPLNHQHPLVPTLYKIIINDTEYLLDDFGKEFVQEAIDDNNVSMGELINRASNFDKSWMLIWSN
ncbi:hypothetical protein EM69_003961 [Salmonella enterica subsp. enterica serovar Typhimurium]|uniref:Uncharacterized protein n=1 Tax=Salmonella phage Sw2 TaxID=2316014 RepID=A0A385INP4_9CAUD|nr:hypothetical protein HOU17_gp023 [Salmonella phage Sw2]AXY84954.1 hypothetical protein CPT_Sw2_023 [Salmonella phage Sw2]ECJ3451808.1 hypothetical protein [Salmonella enterica]EDV2866240.1 hypothetical protein [Salmonella enterica subsp. enterica serovar Typhimurium]EJP0904560.1 hypothetical protein [Salmonella enterica]